MSRINYPYITNFKTNDCLTNTMQINGNLYDSNNNAVYFPLKTGTFAFLSDLTPGVTGPTGSTGPIGATGPTGVTGATGTQTVVAINAVKVINAYITSSGSISYQNGTEIASANTSTTGTMIITLNSYFTATPIVIASAGATYSPGLSIGIFYNHSSSTSTSLTIYTDANGSPSNLDLSLLIIGI